MRIERGKTLLMNYEMNVVRLVIQIRNRYIQISIPTRITRYIYASSGGDVRMAGKRQQ